MQAGARAESLKQPNCVKAKGVIDNVDMFDAAFFGFTPREAQITDPQQRIFLECSWEALKTPVTTQKHMRKIGVYAGSGFSNYHQSFMQIRNCPQSRHISHTHRQRQGLSRNSRLDKLNLRGPGVVVQTACSTSLVAVHMACQALLNGECDIALAGGISIRLPEKSAYFFQEGGIKSPDGHCRAFDADGQGFVSGNGAALVVLKRFADALSAIATTFAQSSKARLSTTMALCWFHCTKHRWTGAGDQRGA